MTSGSVLQFGRGRETWEDDQRLSRQRIAMKLVGSKAKTFDYETGEELRK